MRVVSFYSYKGGTGRTLLLANLAVYAARLGRTVVMVDLDLEAPGLAYKFLASPPRRPGVIEWLTASHRPSVAQMAQPLPVRDPFNDGGALWLVGAGPPPSQAYLREVRHLQSTAFADDSTTAVGGMLDLRDAIEAQLQPDLLLLDARTGISNTNAVTTRVLADDVVALTLDTAEQREGTREVLRSLAPLTKPHDPTQPLGLHIIVSRIPSPEPGVDDTGGGNREKSIADAVRRYLTEPAEPLTATLVLPQGPLLLHEDAAVAVREHLLLAERTSFERSRPLHFDYLRVAQQLWGSDILGPAVAQAFENISETQRFERAAFFGDIDQMLSAKAPDVSAEIRPSLGQDRSTLKRKVDLLRKAAQTDPGREPDLAAALTDLAWATFDARTASTPNGGLRTLRQAHRLYGELADRQPDRYKAVYVDSLIQYSAMAAQLGHLDDAQTAATSAVDLASRSTVGDRMPAAVQGKALANLADIRQKAGNLELAADAIRAATAILDRGPRRSPGDDFLLLRADAHARRAVIEAMLGDATQALRSATIAVDAYREVAERAVPDRPATAVARLGRALNNLAVIHREGRRYVAALEAAEAATDAFRGLASDEPEIYLADLASAYQTLSTCMADAGEHDGALQVAQHAAHLWRDLVDTPAGRRDIAGLVGALNNLAGRYAESGRYDDAVRTCSEAISFAPEAEGNVQPGEPSELALQRAIASTWSTLAAVQRSAQRPDEALQAALTAERIYSTLPPDPPVGPRLDLTLSIAQLYLSLGEPTASKMYAQRAIMLAEGTDDRKGLASAYRVSATAKSRSHQLAAAIRDAREAVELTLATDDLAGAAMSLQLLGDTLRAAGDAAAAATIYQQAADARDAVLDGSHPQRPPKSDAG